MGYEKRYELDALATLETEEIGNPYIAYTLAKPKLMDFGLRVHLPLDEEALKEVARIALKRSLEPMIDDVVSSATKFSNKQVRYYKSR